MSAILQVDVKSLSIIIYFEYLFIIYMHIIYRYLQYVFNSMCNVNSIVYLRTYCNCVHSLILLQWCICFALVIDFSLMMSCCMGVHHITDYVDSFPSVLVG